MENQNNNQPEEEVNNVEQFQMGRSSGSATDGHAPAQSEGYTDDEVEFADGKGTKLDEKLGPDDENEEDDEQTDQEKVDADTAELDKDPNAYDEDDSEML